VLETGHDKTMVLRSGRSAADNVETLEILLQAARCFDEEGVRRGLQDLVPEYSPEKNRSGRIESASASGGIS
jgi:hypothetical protein